MHSNDRQDVHEQQKMYAKTHLFLVYFSSKTY